jgi:L-lactate dehydrogenase complex protein LldG
MSAGRERIFAGIAAALKRAGPSPAVTAQLEARLAAPTPNPMPARGRLPLPARIDLFVEMAREAAATVQRIARAEQAPAAIADYLRAENLPPELRLAPDPWLTGLPWGERPLLALSTGRAEGGEPVAVTAAFAAVAETGTVMLKSGPQSPTTLAFLPETHIVLLRGAQVVGTYEEAWARLRSETGMRMPRTVNLITGPSRSADIEQTLQMGAHGPRRLHIVLIDGDAAT